MKAKLFPQVDPNGRDLGDHVFIFCPGCKGHHSLRVRMPKNPTQQEIDDQRNNVHGLWQWNKDTMNPTFTPSLLIGRDIPTMRCHSQITNGQIRFYDDCHHALKGTTVPLPQLKI